MYFGIFKKLHNFQELLNFWEFSKVCERYLIFHIHET
jgi:hypothetical protein